MDSILQHLKPAAAPTSSDAVKRLVRLQDLERHTGAQTAPRSVSDPVTRRRVLALHSLPAGAADSAPYDRNYPSSLVGAEDEGVIITRTKAVLTRLEIQMDQPQHRVSVILPRTRNITVTTVSGFVTGVDLPSPFSVAWLGGDRWRVAAGRISGGGMESNARDIAGADLSLRVGFIGFWCRLEPMPDLTFLITPSPISGESEYANDGPTRSIDTDGSVTWKPGRMFVPLAAVEAPTLSRRPCVVQISASNLRLPDIYDGPGLPLFS